MVVATLGRYSILASELFDAADAFDGYDVSDFAVEPAPVVTPKSDRELVIEHRARIDRKFAKQDIQNGGEFGNTMYDVASEWLPTQTESDFEWLRNLARKYKRGGSLTDGEAVGVLNCMINDARKPQAPVVESGWNNPVADVLMSRVADKRANDAERDAEAAAHAAYLASRVSPGYYTLVRDNGTHRTLKVGKWVSDRETGGKMRWVSYLNGSDNTSDYQWFAIQTDAGVLRRTRHATDQLMSEAAALLAESAETRAAAAIAYARASGRCARCNLMLTHKDSLEYGYGPECLKYVQG